MKVVEKKVMVPKEVSEIADFIGDVAYDIIKAKTNDGKITSSEVISLVVKSIEKISGVLDGIEKMEDEFEFDEVGFVLAWALQAPKIVKAFEKEPVSE